MTFLVAYRRETAIQHHRHAIVRRAPEPALISIISSAAGAGVGCAMPVVRGQERGLCAQASPDRAARERGKGVDIVFLALLPLAQNDNMDALAAVARELREPDRLERMRGVDGADALFGEMTG